MKKYMTVLGKAWSYSFQRMVEYRQDFILWSIVSLAWTLFSLLFYQILFLQQSTIAGWNEQQAYALVGVFMIIDSATWGLFLRNMRNFVAAVFDGTLDYLLLQPIDAQFRVSVQTFSLTQIPRVITGIWLLGMNLPSQSIWQLAVFAYLVCIALITIYSLWFFSATLTLWFERLENVIEVVPTFRRLWSVPADVYSGPLAAILTIIVPLALITTTPTRVLFGNFRWDEIIILTTFTVVLFCFARWFFYVSMKKYASVGS